MGNVKHVVVAMSGGVDSSVAGYLLLKKGMSVDGVFFILFDDPPAMNFAKEVAKFLGIKLHIEDLRKDFREKVIEPFFNGYRKGITPNPCILCNKYIKFPALKCLADKLNVKWFATGHYARIVRHAGQVILLKGIDKNKDQSYFLYAIEKGLLQQLVFPLGDYIKDEVKKIADEVGIQAKTLEESVEVCFLREKRYYELIKGASHGPIIEKSTGKIVGQHRGIHLFTIGQRKRIGISLGYPAYVVHIDPTINAVYVASREEACWKEIFVEDINWLYDPEGESFECDIKLRYAMNPEKAVVSIINNKAKAVFYKPQFAPAPGQSAVFYRDDVVLGGGIIMEKERYSEVPRSPQSQQ